MFLRSGMVGSVSISAGIGRVEGRRRSGGDVVGQGHVSGGAKAADVGAVFVFDAEERPHASTGDFGEADEEAEDGGVLEFFGVDDVEDPVEAEDGVEEHGEIVDPCSLVSEDVAQEWVFGVRVS